MYSNKEKIEFIWFQGKYILRKINRKMRRRLHIRDQVITSLYGHDFADLMTVQEEIYNRILSGEPFMLGRLGGVESLNA